MGALAKYQAPPGTRPNPLYALSAFTAGMRKPAVTPAPAATGTAATASPFEPGDPEKRGKASNILAGFTGDTAAPNKRFLGM